MKIDKDFLEKVSDIIRKINYTFICIEDIDFERTVSRMFDIAPDSFSLKSRNKYLKCIQNVTLFS